MSILLALLPAFAAPPSLATVGDALAAKASKEGNFACIHDSIDVSIQCDDGSISSQTSLSTFLIEYRGASKKEKKALFKQWVQLLVEPDAVLNADPALQLNNLRPMVKSRADLLSMSRQIEAMGANTSIPNQGITDTLVFTLAIDTEQAMRLVSPADLHNLGLSFDEAAARARSNLDAVPFPTESLTDGLYLLSTLDGYDAARLLLPDQLKALDLPGDPVVLVAARDLIFITGAEDPKLLVGLLNIAAHTLEDEGLIKRISLLPVIYQEGRWTDLVLPNDHPGHAQLEELRALQIGRWYFEQRNSLEALFQTKNLHTPIAKLGGVELNDGSGRHITTLEPTEILLPKADFVTVLHNEEVRLIPWTAFIEGSGEHVRTEPNTFPPLYRVDGEALAADLLRFQAVWMSLDEAFGPPNPDR